MSQTFTRMDQIIAQFETHDQAELAIKELGIAGYDMKNLTIVGRDYHSEEQPIGYVNAGDRMVTWGKFGAFWGTIWGILFGSAVLIIPGVGSVVFAGWLAATLIGAVEGAIVGGGIGAVGAALVSIGIPENTAVAYETAVKAGKFLVMVRGSEEDMTRAKNILEPLGATGLEVSEHKSLELVKS